MNVKWYSISGDILYGQVNLSLHFPNGLKNFFKYKIEFKKLNKILYGILYLRHQSYKSGFKILNKTPILTDNCKLILKDRYKIEAEEHYLDYIMDVRRDKIKAVLKN